MANNETKGSCGNCAGCKCPHHKMIPLFIVIFGVLFLLNSQGMVADDTVGVVWPILVILGGLQKLFRGMCKCCSK